MLLANFSVTSVAMAASFGVENVPNRASFNEELISSNVTKISLLVSNVSGNKREKNRKESIMVLATSPEKTESHYIDIIRNPDGTATLGQEYSDEGGNSPFFARVHKIWDS